MGYLGNKLQGKYHKDTFQYRRQHGVAGDRGVVFHCICGSCRFADGKLAWLLRSCRGRSDDTAEAAWLAFFFALNVSISALVARRRGEQRQGAANETLVTALVFIILAAAAFSVGFVAFASPIIHLCGSTAETHNGAVT